MTQNYDQVFLEGFGIAQPSQRITSEELEQRLAPLYSRLSLHQGRLEMMTGIKERRLCEKGVRPSDLSVEAGEKAIVDSGVDRSEIGCLIHSSVCRDFLEPSTATVVHDQLGLKSSCQVFDLSNACLGWMNGIVQIANMIELGQIEAGLVVSGEDGRGLVDSTIDYLNSDETLTRKTIKGSFASLTIGSGGVAVLLTSKKLAKKSHQLQGAVMESATEFNTLCQGGVGTDEATTNHVIMSTNSEAMLEAGVGLASRCFQRAQNELEISREQIDHVITHQVGSAHSRLLFERLELDENKDFPTYPFLGNMGSASIGTTLILADQAGRLQSDDQIAMMGIGSGLVTMFMGVKW